jgi:hypothetical protein
VSQYQVYIDDGILCVVRVLIHHIVVVLVVVVVVVVVVGLPLVVVVLHTVLWLQRVVSYV